MSRSVFMVGENGGNGRVGSVLNGHSSQESSAIMNYTEHAWIKHQTGFGL